MLSAAVLSTLEAPDTNVILSDSDIVALSERDLLKVKDWIASLKLGTSVTTCPGLIKGVSDMVTLSANAVAKANAADSDILEVSLGKG